MYLAVERKGDLVERCRARRQREGRAGGLDRRLRRSGDGARIAGTLDGDDLTMVGGRQEGIRGSLLHADYSMAYPSRKSHTRDFCSWQWRKTVQRPNRRRRTGR